MSEYWKSTPKYWCKHCSVYVRDTKFERSNHDATGRHKGNLERFLRNLHRSHEQEEREKERAKREVERLNGVVGSSSSATGSGAGRMPPGGSSTKLGGAGPTQLTGGTQSQRQKQWEQLASMGIDVPTELRRDMAMAGEWQVTATRVIEDKPKPDPNANSEAVATGVRKRQKRESEDEAEEVMQNLFKKPKSAKWGRNMMNAPVDDADLDALLSVPLVQPKTEPAEKEKEDTSDDAVKKEPANDTTNGEVTVKSEPGSGDGVPIKAEESAGSGVGAPAVSFKKRKPKNIRQK